MYCRNCGKELTDLAEICIQCGAKPKSGDKYCQNCGAETEPSAEICVKCGVRVKSTTVISQEMYAGFWRRFGAVIIDGVLLWVAEMIIFRSIAFRMFVFTAGAMVKTYFWSILIGWLYFALMESSNKQATLGKMLIGIKVTDLDGNRITFGKATARHFSKIISGVILAIGYIMAGFTQKKQALHDIIAGTLVVKK
jgi:uncharacterized RDD family membrane protein YckC/ribosomal protein L40E